MERIRAAIEKARTTRGDVKPQPAVRGMPRRADAPARTGAWEDLREVDLDANLLARNRVISLDQKDKSYVAFDMIRTRLVSTCRKNNWKVVGITSPTPECGKTVTAANLCFSLSRQRDVQTVLLDCDFRRPSIAGLLGLSETTNLESYLMGDATLQEGFVRYGLSMALSCPSMKLQQPAELLSSQAATNAIRGMEAELAPDFVIVDLPPLGSSDDVMAFMPNLDAVILIAAAGLSTVKEIDECERELAERGNVMGVVMTKCRFTQETYGY
ncbi:MAG: CpsD/CapB family tyrosine-protein kinase [Pseudomonadota bacterium]